MPTTLTLAAMARLLLPVHAVKQPLKTPSYTDNLFRTSDRARSIHGAAPAGRA